MREPSITSTGSDPTTTPHPRMRRLIRAGWIIKSLTAVFVVAFLFAYTHAWLKYGTPRPQTVASVSRPIAQPSFFTPTHYRITHRRRTTYRPVHQVYRRTHRTRPYYLVSLHRLRRFFSRVLNA